jgi:uncharacterized membrane protein
MMVFYILAGLNHLVNPLFYMSIMPGWVPLPLQMVYLSGICEVLFALLLLPAATRRMGAWLIIILLLAIFPANIQMAINFRSAGDPHLWVAIARLPLQLVLIWWAWVYTKP